MEQNKARYNLDQPLSFWHCHKEMLVSMNFLSGEEVLQEKGLLEKAATIKRFEYLPLKLVSTIFYQIFVCTQNDSPLITIENVFYFI